MYLAFDDTDSRKGMCTTYLMAKFLQKTGFAVKGFPRLVRLNPNISYKTRGNGALCVQLGIHGSGTRTVIGSFNGNPIYSYEFVEEIPDSCVLMKEAVALVQEYAELNEESTNPGVVVMDAPLHSDFYSKALSEEITIEEAERKLRGAGANFVKLKNGRGIIGSAAAISWPMNSVTYECIAYRYPRGEPISHKRKIEIAEYANTFPGTFNSIDRGNDYAAIFPKERTPVIYGIRSRFHEGLLNFSSELDQAFGILPESKILYVTNQGTDDHIAADPQSIRELGSYSVEGIIMENPEVIQGGHYFSTLLYNGSGIRIAAFEPTKSFRRIFSSLRTGDRVRVYGSYVNGSLHVEKMQVLDLSREFIRSPPLCSRCGKRMQTRGKDDFRCPSCGSKARHPDYAEIERNLSPGFYDVPVMSRRHLSRPFDIETERAVYQ
ncbi:MAG: TiaS agmantine-binding domain-containing protein [Thermoplasmataceae archaeon]